jgi:Protein of unknown function (DUF3455)
VSLLVGCDGLHPPSLGLRIEKRSTDAALFEGHPMQATSPRYDPAVGRQIAAASKMAIAIACTAMLAACGSAPMAPPFSQGNLPDAVKVPAGHTVALETVGVGQITYECREKAVMAGSFEWVFVGPKAVLNNRAGAGIGKYHGPPASWEHKDGSKITGAQVAVSPAAAGSIPLQLVKANPAIGTGAMQGISYIQRVATQGGVAPATACTADSKGKQEVVNYKADYIFWRAA